MMITHLLSRCVMYITMIGLFIQFAFAQEQSVVSSGQFQVSNWQSFTSLMNVRGAVTDKDNLIWAATSGGVFTVNPVTKEYTIYRNINALRSLDVTCIIYNPTRNSIYAGTFEGTLEIFDKASGTWSHKVDIENSGDQYPKRGINDIVLKGDTAFLATDFGFVLYDLKREVVIETVDRIGTFQQKTPVRKIILTGDSIVVACESGVATTFLTAQPGQPRTLRNPDIWNVLAIEKNTNTIAVLGLTYSQNNLYAITANTVYKRRGDSLLIEQQSPTSSMHYNGITSDDNEVYLSQEDKIISLRGVVVTDKHPSQLNGHTIFRTGATTSFIAFYSTAGIGILNGTQVTYAPNAPLSNRVQDIAIDTKGNLWFTTSNRNIDGQGFTCLQNGIWKNFSNLTTPFVGTDSYTRVNSVLDGSVWLSTWGKGLVRGIPDGDTIKFEYFNNDNSPLVGFPSNPTFTVPGDVISDRKGNTWFVQYGDFINSGAQIFVRNSNNTFTALPYVGNSSEVHRYMNIAIDPYGTKWIASPEENGITYFNDRSTLGSTTDDIWGTKITTSNSLPDNNISALVADKNGAIWIGTPSTGLAVIFSPSVVLNGNTPSVRKISLLNTESINDIMVDALNNKWIATNNGVWVLNEDATEVIGAINKDKYPQLLSNKIKCLSTDENTGTVYIGTLQGLNSFTTLSLKPAEEYSIRCYPQPFIPKHDGQVIIEGLEPESEVRIVTVDGLLVKSIQTRSKRIVWDGKDTNGITVSNGVYIVLAVSAQNARSAVGKIIVLEK